MQLMYNNERKEQFRNHEEMLKKRNFSSTNNSTGLAKELIFKSKESVNVQIIQNSAAN